MPSAIPIDHQSLSKFCHRHHISKLAVFGSVLRDDFSPDSDVDFLVEFEPSYKISRIPHDLSSESLALRGDLAVIGDARSVEKLAMPDGSAILEGLERLHRRGRCEV